MNQWIFPEKLSQEALEKVYETKGKKVSGMSDPKRVLQYIYSRLMAIKGGNFNEFTGLDNPWLPTPQVPDQAAYQPWATDKHGAEQMV